MAATGKDAIEHVIVLMLENRSFDHLLGFSGIDGIDRFDPEVDYNRIRGNRGRKIRPSPTSNGSFPVDPSHSHESVLEQLGIRPTADGLGEPNNSGFVLNYERQASGDLDRVGELRLFLQLTTVMLAFAGLLALITTGRRQAVVLWLVAVAALIILRTFIGSPTFGRGLGPQIMRCIPPEVAPVLTRLAEEYAVFTNWYCSVPGETWPNRQFLHAATSHGKVNISVRPYFNTTIFERLENAADRNSRTRPLGIYFDGPPQVGCFTRLLAPPYSLYWSEYPYLIADIQHEDLPTYAFVEPNHGYFGPANSQHPGGTTHDNASFLRGELLIAEIYGALLAKPGLFQRTAFLITYDEHGGTYDREPPRETASPGDQASRASAFGFERLGPRVPAVLVSPWIERNTVSSDVYDHSSVPATLRSMFAPGTEPLTLRDAAANTFDDVFTSTLRTDLPPVEPPPDPPATTRDLIQEPDDLLKSLTLLMEGIGEQLRRQEQELPMMTIEEFGRVVGPEPLTIEEGEDRARSGFAALQRLSASNRSPDGTWHLPPGWPDQRHR